jgi:dipeptidyl aminopeptidase/acylaminoacyl peptidase
MFTIFTRRFITGLMLGLAMLMAMLPLATPAVAGWHSLTSRLPAYTGLADFEISPDSRYIVFVADIEIDERYELYSVPLTGTMPLKLNPLLVYGGQVYDVAITPDSQYAIYRAKQEAGESRADLYRVPLTGGQADKLNVGPMAGRNVGGFAIDPDNIWVVYEANRQSDEVKELFSAPIAGGTGGQLNPPLVAGGEVLGFAIDPIGNRVVYSAEQEVNARDELYGVPITGGQAVKLNPPGSEVKDFALNPQAPAVVFRTVFGGGYSPLYMNTTAGGLLTPLNYPLASNESVVGFHISPDGGRVVYNVDTNLTNKGRLYSVASGGGDSIPLTIPAEPGYGVSEADFDITADGQRVVYYYQKNAMDSRVLESVALTGNNRATLYEPGAGEILAEQRLSPDGRWLVYNTYPSFQTYTIPAAGGAPVPLGVGQFLRIMPDSSRVIFNHVQPPFDLQSVPIAGGEARNLSRADDQDDVSDSLISPDGQWVVFWVGHKTGHYELRVSDGAEAQPPLPTPTPPPTSNVYPVYLPIIMH